ncbi:EpsG family protein [Maribacter sp. 4G9]|uniref:EpsG family protein n=1 Tax=Maribacter sp. 4G9 TaxID=1889777 RepID=UPI000C15DCA1|nr:EpsG family protein [Maribacter sp. 4G9]PIB23380.1 hypothetical protein BFP75_10255 [Maribacter sp. 4G9]
MEVYKPIVLQCISLLCLLVFFIFSKLKRSTSLKAISLFFILIFVLSVFINRDYSANIDLPLYMDFYKYNVVFKDIFVSKTAWKGDYIFFALMPISHLMGLAQEDYITFQLILSIGLTFLAYFYFFKESRALMFLALFYMLNSSSFYLIQGNVIRQGLSSSLLLLSLCVLPGIQTNLLKFMAFFSHKGSVFSFLTGFLKLKNRVRAIILVLGLLAGYFSLFVLLLKLLPLPQFVITKLEFYSTFERASSNSIIKLGLLLLFNLLFLLFRNRDKNYEKAYSLFFSFSLAALLFFRFDGMFSRLILYTDIFVPILTVGVIQQFSTKSNRVIASAIGITFSMVYSVYVFNHESILFNMGKYFSV